MTRHRHAAFLTAASFLSRFTNTFLFEFCYRSRSLIFSDNLPKALNLAFQSEGASWSAQLETRLPPEDWSKFNAHVQAPPAPGQEVLFEVRLRHEDGCYVFYECRLVSTYDRRGRPAMLLGRFENIDARKQREANLITRSTRDDLTGLLNRSAVSLRVEEWVHSSRAQRGGALFMLDLDSFKAINDTQGHTSGDQALLLTAQILRETFRGSDILGRAGGDEFLVFMPEVSSYELACARADAVCNALEQRSGEALCGCTFTCSVGIALYPQHGDSYAALFDAADAAMYLAKREGKNSYRLYAPSPI